MPIAISLSPDGVLIIGIALGLIVGMLASVVRKGS